LKLLRDKDEKRLLEVCFLDWFRLNIRDRDMIEDPIELVKFWQQQVVVLGLGRCELNLSVIKLYLS
jgi:hypothetical protein